MLNAKTEFLDSFERSSIRCAVIERYDVDEPIQLVLGYSDAEWDNFLNQLDFEYDDGYGRQYLFGVVWFCDGSWAERAEYDGSEWWENRRCPEIPNFFEDTTV